MNFRNCFFPMKKSAKVWRKKRKNVSELWTFLVYPYSLTFKNSLYAKNYASKIGFLGFSLQKAAMDFFLVL